MVAEALAELGGAAAISLADLRSRPAALQRLVLRRMVEEAGGELGLRETRALLALGDQGTKALDLGGGLRAVAEYGMLRFTRAGASEAPGPVELPVPGRARFGDWEVEATLAGPGEVAVSAAALGGSATVRSWREGDRMRPTGLGGTKTLQDLFTDRKIPRALRRALPVVESGGTIVWVAGMALDERFAAPEGESAVWLGARSLR
jgi:tRNA(Ile)-lysidine synthase